MIMQEIRSKALFNAGYYVQTLILVPVAKKFFA